MSTTRTLRRAAGTGLLAAVLTWGAVTVPDADGVTSDRAGPALSEAAAARTQGGPAKRPNVIVITADDMRADDLTFMPHTRRLLGRLDLTEFVSNHPLCCPARAQLLTGQLAQHNGVLANPGPDWGGYSALRAKNNTVARWFRRSGYSTALVGKFLNGWCPAEGRPRGWSDFKPLVRKVYSAYRYSHFDGKRTRPAPDGLHTNDFVTTRTLGRIRSYASARRPFFIWASYVAPHNMATADRVFGPPVPAERHVGTMEGVIPLSESKPSYEDVPAGAMSRALVADTTTCSGSRAAAEARAGVTIRELNQGRLESLQSVDEGVRRIVRQLRERKQLGRTIIVFTSDNGFLLGEHGRLGKNSYYEESLRVPLLARGPAVAVGPSDKGAMMVDVAPSLAHAAGVAPERVADGRRDLLTHSQGWDGALVQAGGVATPWAWRGIRTDRWTYVEQQDGTTVLYDRDADPYQLLDLSGQHPDVEELLHEQLNEMTR